MFISDKFYLDGVHSDEIGVSLITLDTDVINDYGISFSKNVEVDALSSNAHVFYEGGDDLEDIVLYMCPASEGDLTWDNELIEDVYRYLLQDKFMSFISEDDLDLIYYIKPTKITKKFSASMEGYLEVTFKLLSNCAYKRDLKKGLVQPEKRFTIKNISNTFDKFYMPIIEIENLDINKGTIIIENLTLGCEPMLISGLKVGEKIIIDNAMCTVVGINNENKLKCCNRKWIKLCKSDNLIRVSGHCNIVIKSEFPLFR